MNSVCSPYRLFIAVIIIILTVEEQLPVNALVGPVISEFLKPGLVLRIRSSSPVFLYICWK